MGRSAKFYKRPTKKEKEGLALKKLVEPSAIKKKSAKDKKTISIPDAVIAEVAKKKPMATDEDVDMTANETKVADTKVKKQQKDETELPDYVDLFSGKKTYKKVPAKRK